MYFGPREGVMPFFNSMGFALPARKGIADFLQEVRDSSLTHFLIAGGIVDVLCHDRLISNPLQFT